MFDSVYLKEFGLYAIDGFLDRDFCFDLIGEVETADLVQSPLPEFVDGKLTTTNRTQPMIVIGSATSKLAEIGDRVYSVKHKMEAYFNLPLESIQSPVIGVYEVGQYTAKHVDALEKKLRPGKFEQRKVTIIIFLNDESDEKTGKTYEGGQLTFHGVLDKEPFRSFGLPVKGITGTLIAFPATFMHEVTPVSRGRRFIVNSGYF